jgi:serine/threonine protein kinase
LNNQHAISTVEIDKRDLKYIKSISEGAFGKVYLGTYMEKEVAIKKYKEKNRKIDTENFLKEVEILSSLRHKNVVLYMGVCLNDRGYRIITE